MNPHQISILRDPVKRAVETLKFTPDLETSVPIPSGVNFDPVTHAFSELDAHDVPYDQESLIIIDSFAQIDFTGDVEVEDGFCYGSQNNNYGPYYGAMSKFEQVSGFNGSTTTLPLCTLTSRVADQQRPGFSYVNPIFNITFDDSRGTLTHRFRVWIIRNWRSLIGA